jgi:hypothetical protein
MQRVCDTPTRSLLQAHSTLLEPVAAFLATTPLLPAALGLLPLLTAPAAATTARFNNGVTKGLAR